jgi:hypothetical protein
MLEETGVSGVMCSIRAVVYPKTIFFKDKRRIFHILPNLSRLSQSNRNFFVSGSHALCLNRQQRHKYTCNLMTENY